MLFSNPEEASIRPAWAGTVIFVEKQLYLINILYNIGNEECEIKYRIALQNSKNDEAEIQATSFFKFHLIL